MGKYKISQKAIDDLSKIWEYTYHEWSELQADKYYWMLINTCNEISDNPEIGKEYSIIAKDLCGMKSGRHIVFYLRKKNKDIEIIRVLHEQMDLKTRIKK
jgi:toxin ParE1/3/4